MSKLSIEGLAEKIGENVEVLGWIQNIRDHGNVIFVDLRDRSGVIQLVIFNKKMVSKANQELNIEHLVEVKGVVQKRPEKMINPDLLTGEIELAVEDFEIITKADLLPFEIDQNTKKVNEAVRLQYRYLDLRSDRMRVNLQLRHRINLFLRNYLSDRGFWEIETPLLTKGTPEGSREFIVPSRLNPKQFYVLPQSPQQFKQLLMVGGIEKYFQIARCFRDEDQRSDRQPEFTQLDLEASFVDDHEIMRLVEEAVIGLVENIFPHLPIREKPFPRIEYKNAMEKYKSDKPDLRADKNSDELAFCWVVNFPLFEYSTSEGKITACHHPFTRPVEQDIDLLDKDPLKVRAVAYDLVLNGVEVGGGSLRIHEQDLQREIFQILGLSEDEINTRFGHMLEAFKFSPPPHGGIALGLDRLISLLLNEESIREVIAFPKTGDARDLLFGAPSTLPTQVLKDVHVKV